MKGSVLSAVLLLLPFVTTAQEEDTASGFWKALGEKTEAYGYLKHLQQGSWQAGAAGDLTTQAFFHNRLNFRAYPFESLTMGLELRNRLFYGEGVKADPNYGQRLMGEYPQRFELSDLLVEESGVVLHSKIDRAWMRYSKGDWEVSVGRQRINWSTNLVWNPNDLFNAYSFVDFDYEERPGSDAIRLRYFPGSMSSVDLAWRPGEEEDERIAAFRYKFNLEGYDIQVLGGQYLTDAALGLGWAGNLGNSGLKGEATYFHPYEEARDTSGVVNAALTFDHMFPNSLYVAAGFLWNSEGIEEVPQQPINIFPEQITAKNLMPTAYSGLLQFSYQFDPLLSGDIAGIWSPGANALFLMPSITYSIQEDWDISLHGQTFFMESGMSDEMENLGNLLFMRLRWSF